MIRTILLFVFAVTIISCGDDDPSENREDWVGTYEGTKSNRSFDDDMFTTDITFTVELKNDSLLIINDLEVPISDDGTFQGAHEGTSFDVEFSNGSVKMRTTPIVIGLASSCYIKGDKQ